VRGFYYLEIFRLHISFFIKKSAKTSFGNVQNLKGESLRNKKIENK